MAASADDATAALAANAGAVAMLADPRWATVRSAPAPVVTAEPVDDVQLGPVVVLPDRVLSGTLVQPTAHAPASTAKVLAVAALQAAAGDQSVIVAPGNGWVVDGTQTVARHPDASGCPLRHSAPSHGGAVGSRTAPPWTCPSIAADPSDAGSDQAVGAVSALGRLDVMATAADSPSPMVNHARRAVFAAMSLTNRRSRTPSRRSSLPRTSKLAWSSPRWG